MAKSLLFFFFLFFFFFILPINENTYMSLFAYAPVTFSEDAVHIFLLKNGSLAHAE